MLAVELNGFLCSLSTFWFWVFQLYMILDPSAPCIILSIHFAAENWLSSIILPPEWCWA